MSTTPSPLAPDTGPVFREICSTERERFVTELRQFKLWNHKIYAFTIEHQDDGLTVWYWIPVEELQDRDTIWSIRFTYVPGTKAARILANEEDLPEEYYRKNITINGDIIEVLNEARELPPTPTAVEPIILNEALFVPFPPFEISDVTSQHLVSNPSSAKEVERLASIYSGAEEDGLQAPTRGAEYVSQVVGRLPTGELVRHPKPIEKTSVLRLVLNPAFRTVSNVTKLFLEIIDAQSYLHDCGVIGTSMALDHLGEITVDNNQWKIVVHDIRDNNHLRNHYPPEFYLHHSWDKKADIYALGMVLWEIVYANNSPWLARYMSLRVPDPFADIFIACTQANPDLRPSIDELRLRVLAVSSGSN